MSGVRQLIKKKPKITTAINQDEWLLSEMESFLGHTSQKKREGVFYPSSLGNPCDRFLYLSYHGMLPGQEIAAVLQRIFDCGDSLGLRFEKYFANMGLLLATESPVKCESPSISGRIDFIIKHKDFPQAVIELKSINTRGFKALLDRPKPEHVVQIQIYLNLANIEHGILLYEDKNDQQLKAFVVKRDEKVWTKLQERCFNVINMVEVPLRCTGLKYCPCKGV